MGSVPAQVVPDNPKVGVSRANWLPARPQTAPISIWRVQNELCAQLHNRMPVVLKPEA
jgi:hypothetical protein